MTEENTYIPLLRNEDVYADIEKEYPYIIKIVECEEKVFVSYKDLVAILDNYHKVVFDEVDEA